MPKQDYVINIAPAAAGDVYGLAFTNSQRFTYNTESAMTKWGLAVQHGAKSDTCKLGINADGGVLGITMRQNNLESATRPGDGTIGIPVGQPLAIMCDGPIQVKLITAITDENIGVSPTGTFGGVAAGYVKAVNLKAMKYPAAAGDVIPVMVVMQGPKV